MSADHDALVVELRALADAVLDRLEQTVQRFAESVPHDRPGSTERTGPAAATGEPGDGRPAASACSWCPVCAAAAAIRGEPHELLTRLATQIAAMITLLRELLARYLPAPETRRDGSPSADGPPPQDPPPPSGRGGAFVPISVTLLP